MKSYILFYNLWILLALLNVSSCKSQDTVTISGESRSTYENPVIKANVPDPTVIRVGDYFYLYCTEGSILNMPIYQSKNLVDWSLVGTAFDAANRPSSIPGARLWAPDIRYINGKYVYYYTMGIWGDLRNSGIGRAISDHPVGPFTDVGKLFTGAEIGVLNSIDPCIVEDDGKWWLFWGSYWGGIHAIELTEDGLHIKAGAVKQQVAGDKFEGTYIHKRGQYYYLFASTGTCCEGTSSTYTTVVGRSENILGPYTDSEGRDMLDNNYEIVVHNGDRFVGVGHNAGLVQDKEGNDWLLYHGYDRQFPINRRLLLDKIEWVNDWPQVKNKIASETAKAPVL